MLMPGEQCAANLTLVKKMPIVEGQSFTVRENRTTVATGIITKALQPIEVDKRKLNLLVIPSLKLM